MAKQHHPDVANSHGSGAHFQRVQRAWETLRCPQQRLAYDSTTRFETNSQILRHRAAKQAAYAAQNTAPKMHWYEDLRQAAQQERMRQEMNRKEKIFPDAYDDPVRMQAQQFERVMREVRSNPDFGQFVGAGLQMKLICQLGFILAAMLSLLLWAWAKQQRSQSSTRPPSSLDRALKSVGIDLR